MRDIPEFLKTAINAPILDAEAERVALRRYRENGDLAARDLVAGSYFRLVAKYARIFSSNKVGWDDLFQAGVLSLYEAIDHFRDDENVKFATYALRCIKSAFSSLIGEETLVRIPHRVWNIDEPVTPALRRMLSLDAVIHTDDGEAPATLGDLVEQRREQDPDAIVEREDILDALSKAFWTDLNDNERDVVLGYYFAGQKLDQLKGSRQRAHQLLQSAIRKLRVSLS